MTTFGDSPFVGSYPTISIVSHRVNFCQHGVFWGSLAASYEDAYRVISPAASGVQEMPCRVRHKRVYLIPRVRHRIATIPQFRPPSFASVSGWVRSVAVHTLEAYRGDHVQFVDTGMP